MSARRVVHTRPAPWPSLSEARFASRIQRDSADGCQLALLGLPDDTGVRLNGGRAGAAQGPAALRAALAAFGTHFDLKAGRRLAARIFDAGDVEPAPGDDAQALLATHQRVEAALMEIHGLGLVPLCVGGGHDLSLPSLRALSRHVGHAIGGVNVDAHLDARARVGSGMAFRSLISEGWLDARRFTELGLGRFVNEESDIAWLRERGAQLLLNDAMDSVPASSAAVLARACGADGVAFLSVDLDAIDGGQLPGVSALNPSGLAVARVAELAEAAGRAPGIRHCDVMELCPVFDPSGRSARIAAYLLLCFIAGFDERPR